MKSTIEQLSGNAYKISLMPESKSETILMEAGVDQDKIGQYYQQAIKEKFGEHISPASLTALDDFPFSAVAEMFSESGSVNG